MALILGLLTTVLLFAGRFMGESGLSIVLFIIAGVTTMAALAALPGGKATGVRQRRPRDLNVTFNTAIVTRDIAEGLRTVGPLPLAGQVPPQPPWELTPRRLVGRDNSLALAYLRLELERALRAVAQMHGVDMVTAVRGTQALADDLVERRVLPASWATALRQVIQVCNSAVHGAVVGDDTALAVVSAGEELLGYLRTLSGAYPPPPTRPAASPTPSSG